MTAVQFQQYLREPLLLVQLSASQLEALVREYPYCGLLRQLLVRKCQMMHQSEEELAACVREQAAYVPDRVRLHELLSAAAEGVDNGLLSVNVVSENPPRISARELGLEKKTLIPTDLSFVLQVFDKESVQAGSVQSIMAKKKKQKNASPTGGETGDESAAKKRFRLPRIAVLEENKQALDNLTLQAAEDTTATAKQEQQEQAYVLEEDPELGFVQDVDDAFRFLQQTEHFLRSLSERMQSVQQEHSPASVVQEDEAAQASVSDNDEIASETLARLLLAQNQRAKAIKIYKRLMRKQPERSAYFSQLIEEAKK